LSRLTVREWRGVKEMKKTKEKIIKIIEEIDTFGETKKIELINFLRINTHRISPFNKEPVDCIQWVKADEVVANDYNPNAVAPPEMQLLEHSVREDGYTQPIVAWRKNGHFEVVDGFR
jgi:ParB-like chromosome segregation protein Spo0J